MLNFFKQKKNKREKTLCNLGKVVLFGTKKFNIFYYNCIISNFAEIKVKIYIFLKKYSIYDLYLFKNPLSPRTEHPDKYAN